MNIDIEALRAAMQAAKVASNAASDAAIAAQDDSDTLDADWRALEAASDAAWETYTRARWAYELAWEVSPEKAAHDAREAAKEAEWRAERAQEMAEEIRPSPLDIVRSRVYDADMNIDEAASARKLTERNTFLPIRTARNMHSSSRCLSVTIRPTARTGCNSGSIALRLGASGKSGSRCSFTRKTQASGSFRLLWSTAG